MKYISRSNPRFTLLIQIRKCWLLLRHRLCCQHLLRNPLRLHPRGPPIRPPSHWERSRSLFQSYHGNCIRRCRHLLEYSLKSSYLHLCSYFRSAGNSFIHLPIRALWKKELIIGRKSLGKCMAYFLSKGYYLSRDFLHQRTLFDSKKNGGFVYKSCVLTSGIGLGEFEIPVCFFSRASHLCILWNDDFSVTL